MQSEYIEILVQRYPSLAELKQSIAEAAQAIITSYEKGGKLLVCGNGGSAADADHIVGELLKSFEKKRPLDEGLKSKMIDLDFERGKYLADNLQQGLPAISLSAHTALTTAVSNDIHGDVIYAQQVTAYGNPGDAFIGISCSGNSNIVINALIVAKAKGLTTIGLSGETGGKMKPWCDILLNVPEKRTAFAQELHLPIYHTLCLVIEDHFFGKNC